MSIIKWISLFLLTAGVAIVQLEGIWHWNGIEGAEAVKVEVKEIGDARIGLLAILAACLSSGLAGGWFEYVLKTPTAPPPMDSLPATPSSAKSSSLSNSNSIRKRNVSPPPSTPSAPVSPSKSAEPRLELRPDSPSLWARNLQLSVPSLLFSFIGLLLSFSDSSLHLIIMNLFWNGAIVQGFTPLVWIVVLNQALGGLLVAMVIRETDGVAKGFATSVAIIGNHFNCFFQDVQLIDFKFLVSTIVSAIFTQTIPGPLFLIGAALVILSTIIYAADRDN